MFKSYIDKWYERKKNAQLEKNEGQRTLAKLMLNSLYGKFATSLKAKSKIPYLENSIVHYKLRRRRTKERVIYSNWCIYYVLCKRKND